jgi:hypothetical protein
LQAAERLLKSLYASRGYLVSELDPARDLDIGLIERSQQPTKAAELRSGPCSVDPMRRTGRSLSPG